MLLADAGMALAQQDQGMVAGRVTDPSDAVVSGAVVTATSANGATAETTTNADGHYLLAPLVIGRYQITLDTILTESRRNRHRGMLE